MGVQERESKKRERLGKIERAVLETIKLGGIMAIALVAPNVLHVFKKNGLIPYPYQNRVITAARKKLLKKGLLHAKDGFLELTPEGHRKLNLLQIKVEKPKRWDGKWRVLIFDIKEDRKGLREKVRHTLRAIGFERLQDSVWLYPYDCEDLIVLLKADFRMGKEMLYMIVDSIENDQILRKNFGI